MIAYLILAAWFWLVDMLAGHLAGSRPRPVAAAVIALLWPASVAFTVLASAVLVRRYRDASPTPEGTP